MHFRSGAAVSIGLFASLSAHAEPPPLRYADQGGKWTSEARRDFYTRDQGSRVIPYAWLKALTHPDGRGFLDDSLARYGYLPNPAGKPSNLPVGFHVADQDGVKTVGMTCAACHTRQIEAQGAAWRIDGGPALVDFQRFLADLDGAVTAALANDAAFKDFAHRVGAASESARNRLRSDVDAWFLPYHAIMSKALPTPPWGPARADAVSMIFNRLAGLDVGPAPIHIIESNIAIANAPVRYPFVWNAPIQDTTQWPGFAKNGDNILGLARNLGEVIGVFGVFHPKQMLPGIVNFIDGSSVNFPGLLRLENLAARLGPPRWPWPIDTALAAKGKAIFDRDPSQGGCGPTCHELKPGRPRLLNKDTWATPQIDVGTDTKEYSVLGRKGLTGELEGKFNPMVTDAPLQHEDRIIAMLGVSVLGSIAQDAFQNPQRIALLGIDPLKMGPLHEVLENELHEIYTRRVMQATPDAHPFKYEARVLQGVWAAAPFLHNGSVPTLADLLTPPSKRAASFKIGPAYDIENVGLAKDQSAFDYTYQTTGCDRRDSGDSHCGHEFGTALSAEEKRALLEYLKQL